MKGSGVRGRAASGVNIRESTTPSHRRSRSGALGGSPSVGRMHAPHVTMSARKAGRVAGAQALWAGAPGTPSRQLWREGSAGRSSSHSHLALLGEGLVEKGGGGVGGDSKGAGETPLRKRRIVTPASAPLAVGGGGLRGGGARGEGGLQRTLTRADLCEGQMLEREVREEYFPSFDESAAAVAAAAVAAVAAGGDGGKSGGDGAGGVLSVKSETGQVYSLAHLLHSAFQAASEQTSHLSMCAKLDRLPLHCQISGFAPPSPPPSPSLSHACPDILSFYNPYLPPYP